MTTITLCPYAALVSCSKCPVKKVCLLKGVIGDHKKNETDSNNKNKESD
jgi:hypothetical protein